MAERTQEFLKEINKEADYINTIIMADNALIVFDMYKQKQIIPEKKIDEHLALIKEDIDQRKNYIQPAPEEELEFCQNYKNQIAENGPAYTFPLYKVTDECLQCGTCVNICLMGCIEIVDGKVKYDYSTCIN